ncbi:MAG: hypothetical protein P8X39_04445, partial [Desulfofustis sp.]
LWNSLPTEQQQIISAQVRKMESRRYEVAQRDEQRNIAALKELGVTVYDLQEAEYDAMKQKVKEVVWPQLRKDIGPTFDDVVEFAE